MCSPEGLAWFLPAALLFLLGQLLPLVLQYWLELRLKLQFLLASQAQQAPQPGAPACVPAAAAVTDCERLWQLQQAQSRAEQSGVIKLCLNGIIMSVGYAYFVAALAPHLTPAACGASMQACCTCVCTSDVDVRGTRSRSKP